MTMDAPRTLLLLEQIARRLAASDVIALLDNVDRWGGRYAARVVIVGGSLTDRRTVAEQLTGQIFGNALAMAWGAFGVIVDAEAACGAEIVLCLGTCDESTFSAGEVWQFATFTGVETLRAALLTTLSDSDRRAALQRLALEKVGRYVLPILENAYATRQLPIPPVDQQTVGLAVLRRDIETEARYIAQRLNDDFNSFRYRTTEVSDLDQFNVTVRDWLTHETEMLSDQLSSLIQRVTADIDRLTPPINIKSAHVQIIAAPTLHAEALELTTRPLPAEDRTRAAISLGGGGLIAVVSQVLFSAGPAAALATGAAAGIAAYWTLNHNAAQSTDPVQAFFDVMQNTTLADVQRQITETCAALLSAITPLDALPDPREAVRDAEIRALLDEAKRSLPSP